MNLLLFIFALVVSFIIVRIGAIAFELTGLEWNLAKFQSLSCFTGTGFTTREAELITNNTQRRRIASVLIILGHAGVVTLVATFANVLRPNIVSPKLIIPLLHFGIPSNLVPWINLLIIILFIYIIYQFLLHTKLAKRITDFLRKHIIKKEFVKAVSFEELVVATGGYGISQIEVCADSPILDQSLSESNLRSHDITVLAIEREGETIPNPHANMKILLGDKLICFGKLGQIRKELCIVPQD